MSGERRREEGERERQREKGERMRRREEREIGAGVERGRGKDSILFSKINKSTKSPFSVGAIPRFRFLLTQRPKISPGDGLGREIAKFHQ